MTVIRPDGGSMKMAIPLPRRAKGARSTHQKPCFLSRLGLIGLESIEPAVLAALATESPLLLIGIHGSGKSMLLERVANALGLAWRHYNASLLNFDDLVGYPFPDDKGQLRFVQTPASVWGAQAILIDEISRARIDIQNRLFPIIHEKRVQGIALESLRHRWAAMNPPPTSDDVDAAEYRGSEALDVALSDRFAFHVRVPDWREFDQEAQELVALADYRDMDPAIGDDFIAALASIRQAIALIDAQWRACAARYVRVLATHLDKAGRQLSARRAGMIVRNVVAVHAARRYVDESATFADSVWIAVRHSMPFMATGLALDDGKLLLCHREAWRSAEMPDGGPFATIFTERDPIKRVQLALLASDLPDGELTAIVVDALHELPDGARHALAEWLLETPAVQRLSTVASDEASVSYRELTCAPRISETVADGSPRHNIWKAVESYLGAQDLENPRWARLTNLLPALFAAKRLTHMDHLGSVVQAFDTARRQLKSPRQRSAA